MVITVLLKTHSARFQASSVGGGCVCVRCRACVRACVGGY